MITWTTCPPGNERDPGTTLSVLDKSLSWKTETEPKQITQRQPRFDHRTDTLKPRRVPDHEWKLLEEVTPSEASGDVAVSGILHVLA